MTQLDHSVRINLLLLHLRSGRWRAAPKNVGLKTGLTAEEMGLVEARGELRRRTYRLTAAGKDYMMLRISAEATTV